MCSTLVVAVSFGPIEPTEPSSGMNWRVICFDRFSEHQPLNATLRSGFQAGVVWMSRNG
jgi:hypothetical protein